MSGPKMEPCGTPTLIPSTNNHTLRLISEVVLKPLNKLTGKDFSRYNLMKVSAPSKKRSTLGHCWVIELEVTASYNQL